MPRQATNIKGWIEWGTDYQEYEQGEYDSEFNCEGHHTEGVSCHCITITDEKGTQPLIRLIDEELNEAEYRVVANKRLTVTVSWHISDRYATLEELQIDAYKQVTGIADSEFGHNFSDLTGYLWTDEGFVVNGHDITEEIKSHIGEAYYAMDKSRKYLHMQIIYNECTIDEMVEEWHMTETNMKVWEYLGITEKEYMKWVENPNNVPKSWR